MLSLQNLAGRTMLGLTTADTATRTDPPLLLGRRVVPSRLGAERKRRLERSERWM